MLKKYLSQINQCLSDTYCLSLILCIDYIMVFSQQHINTWYYDDDSGDKQKET